MALNNLLEVIIEKIYNEFWKLISNKKDTTYITILNIKWCNHNQMSQQWQWTQPQMGLLWSFWLFHRMDFFCNMFSKIFTIPPIDHMIFVNYFWRDMNCLKMYRSWHILHFVLKINHNGLDHNQMIQKPCQRTKKPSILSHIFM